jgi:hypothetical protein
VIADGFFLHKKGDIAKFLGSLTYSKHGREISPSYPCLNVTVYVVTGGLPEAVMEAVFHFVLERFPRVVSLELVARPSCYSHFFDKLVAVSFCHIKSEVGVEGQHT